jgi:hypothetical protein
VRPALARDPKYLGPAPPKRFQGQDVVAHLQSVSPGARQCLNPRRCSSRAGCAGRCTSRRRLVQETSDPGRRRGIARHRRLRPALGLPRAPQPRAYGRPGLTAAGANGHGCQAMQVLQSGADSPRPAACTGPVAGAASDERAGAAPTRRMLAGSRSDRPGARLSRVIRRCSAGQLLPARRNDGPAGAAPTTGRSGPSVPRPRHGSVRAPMPRPPARDARVALPHGSWSHWP